jgi:hypothetical protein
MRVPAVHDQRRAIKSFCEEACIGITLEPIWHVAVPVSDHAVSRHNGVTFDAEPLHGVHH